MSFNFQALMAAFANMLPAIGTAVEELHPGDNQEAAKINVGSALITGIVGALQSASAPASPATLPVSTPAPLAAASPLVPAAVSQ